MGKYKTEQLILLFFVVAFLLFTLLGDKSAIFRNCSLLSLAGIIEVKGYENIKNGNETRKQYGKMAIIFGIIIILTIFAGGNRTISSLIIIGFFTMIYIYYKLIITKQHTKIYPYMGLLFLGNIIVSVLITELIFKFLSLPKTYTDAVCIFIYFTMWIMMSLYGQVNIMKKCDLVTGSFLVITLMISILCVDIITPPLLQQNDVGKILSAFASEFGYTVKDILKIIIEVITYPFIITTIISYIVLHFREQKAKL